MANAAAPMTTPSAGKTDDLPQAGNGSAQVDVPHNTAAQATSAAATQPQQNSGQAQQPQGDCELGRKRKRKRNRDHPDLLAAVNGLKADDKVAMWEAYQRLLEQQFDLEPNFYLMLVTGLLGAPPCQLLPALLQLPFRGAA